ncbi:hypothetical protein ACFPRL_08675 [Pseudoclavibacter helvolus]
MALQQKQPRNPQRVLRKPRILVRVRATMITRGSRARIEPASLHDER